MASIRVKYETDDTDLVAQGYKLRVTAHTPVGMPAEILVMKAVPGPSGRENDEFDRIASAVDLEETPAGAPQTTMPYYRVATLELFVRTPGELAEVRAAIDEDVRSLVTALNTEYETEEDVSYE